MDWLSRIAIFSSAVKIERALGGRGRQADGQSQEEEAEEEEMPLESFLLPLSSTL